MSWVDRQLPENEEIFLDHVGYFVNDLCAAGTSFERLGFTVSPINIHYNAESDGNLTRSGTANRLITFGFGYIELLSAVGDTPLANQLKAALGRYVGLHLIAFTHVDMEAQRERLFDTGFEPQPTLRLRRPIETQDGQKTVRATVVRAKPGIMPEGRVQMLCHETPELIWRSGYTDHENKADALTDIVIISDDPDGTMDRYALFTGCQGMTRDNLRVVSLARGCLTFASPKAAASFLPGLKIPDLPYIAAVGLRSTDLAATRKVLKKHDVTLAVNNETVICIESGDGMGAYVVFHAPDKESSWPFIH
ncbi:MAG: VOC family protein [Pseudomonadota bacterium]